MELSQSIDNLRCLADGIDPSTGEVLPVEHPLQHPQLIRTFYTALGALEAPAAKRRDLPPNSGKPWSDTDDAELSQAAEAGAPLEELCLHFGRTRNAIRMRLDKLGVALAEEPEDALAAEPKATRVAEPKEAQTGALGEA